MTEYVRRHNRARKSHKCILCHRTIYRGEIYLVGTSFTDGQVRNWKECAHCDALFTYLYSLSDEDEYSEELAEGWEPDTIIHARIKAMWNMKWQRRDGKLLPAPVVVREERHSGEITWNVVTGLTLNLEN